MFFPQNRDDIRQVYIKTWQKIQATTPLEPLESLIADVIQQHPEYHNLLNNAQAAVGNDFSPESGGENPFVHMGLHIAIREQLSIDQPQGICTIYAQLLSQHRDAHAVEHGIMECLGDMVWHAQRNQQAPNEQRYLRCLRKQLTQQPA